MKSISTMNDMIVFAGSTVTGNNVSVQTSCSNHHSWALEKYIHQNQKESCGWDIQDQIRLSNKLHRLWMIVFAGSTENNTSIQFKPELRRHYPLSARGVFIAFVTVHGWIESLGSCGAHCAIFVTMVCWRLVAANMENSLVNFRSWSRAWEMGLVRGRRFVLRTSKGAPLLHCSSTCFISAVTFVGASVKIGHRKAETLPTRWSTKWNLRCSLAQSRLGF